MLGFVWKLWDVMAASLVPKGLSFMQASARTGPLAECAAGGSAASHTKCQPWHFCDVGVLFVASPQAFPLDPTSFHAEWLTHCMSRDEVPSLRFAVHSLFQYMGALSLGCFHGFYSQPRASQGLSGPWCTQEELLQLLKGLHVPA